MGSTSETGLAGVTGLSGSRGQSTGCGGSSLWVGAGAGCAAAVGRRLAKNLRFARLSRAEIAGSLGDLGTFLPLLVAMSVGNGLDFSTSLFFAGVFTIITGLMFRIPMAIQPMKAIAAIAIAQGLSAHEIAAAGAVVGVIVLGLGWFGVIGMVERVVPRAVVRGVQLTLGITLALKGARMAEAGWVSGPTGWVVVGGAIAVVALLLRSRMMPAGLVLFAGGVGMALWNDAGARGALALGWSMPAWDPPRLADFVRATPVAALPQIPLTTLNSVVAVCALSGSLFPDRRVGTVEVARSVGLMNLVGCWFGAMPMCHGAGGLAGQYRFGARTNGSLLFLGTAKVLLAVLLGSALLPLCRAFPEGVLGVMLMVAGVELSLAARQRGWAWVPTLATVAGGLATGNIAVGFGAGMWVCAALDWRER